MTDVFAEDSSYLKAVKLAVGSSRFFEVFKRDSGYRNILEHVSEGDGQKYLDILKLESPDLLERIDEFKINDKQGSPITYTYEKIGMISPTTLRYIKVASDLRKLFGDLSDFTIAEIGIGYGGQMLILDQLWNTSYCLFDLPPVIELTRKYTFSILKQTQIINEFTTLDLVVSNYAFSELNTSIQEQYIKNVLCKAKRGYLTMNYIDGFSIEELKKKLPNFSIYTETPLTGPNNNLIVWGQGL
jgi:hypothetical protein